MDLNEIKEIPKNYFKETLRSFFKLEKLKRISHFGGVHFNDAEKELVKKINNYKKVEKEAIKTWKIVELSRNEGRPHTPDYISNIFEDFIELSGDRETAEDKSITAGLGKINGVTVAVIGHNKGKDIKERVEFNFGMSMPQGYRKSQRIMQLAGRFGFPIITLIDTPGAYAALEAEDSGQASAIAKSLLIMFELEVPVIVVLIGEGGSGGALALAIGNYVIMLENSTYSVISPEGCAAILWKDPSGSKLAARALKLTSRNLLRMGVIDRIIFEPMGGAQTDPARMIRIVKRYVVVALEKFKSIEGKQLKEQRAQKFETMGFLASYQQDLFSDK
jgi:acetyl-CoA carboxylase carboxyl transferase subunit alpha